MAGLPPEVQAKTLAYYEQRFVDGVAAGRTEEDVARELDDPKKIAMTLRASTHLRAFEEKRNPATLLRLLVSGVGLAVFNLFMVVPAIVYASLLAALYACALALYFGGVVVTASGLAGANELVLEGPLRNFIYRDGGAAADEAGQARVTIDETGVHVTENTQGDEAGQARVTIDETGVHVTENTQGDDLDPGAGNSRSESVIREAEAVAERGVRISTGIDADSRATQTALGLAMVLGGIALFLLGLVVTRYTVIGIRRYIQMNLSLLRGG